MLGEEATEGVLSSCRRDVGYEIFFGKQAIGYVDEKRGHQEHRYRQMLYRVGWVSHGEEAATRGGEVVSGHGSCLRVEASVGEAQGNVDGMCWSTCRLCESVSNCI